MSIKTHKLWPQEKVAMLPEDLERKKEILQALIERVPVWPKSRTTTKLIKRGPRQTYRGIEHAPKTYEESKPGNMPHNQRLPVWYMDQK
jgi:hypothetical protein